MRAIEEAKLSLRPFAQRLLKVGDSRKTRNTLTKLKLKDNSNGLADD